MYPQALREKILKMTRMMRLTTYGFALAPMMGIAAPTAMAGTVPMMPIEPQQAAGRLDVEAATRPAEQQTQEESSDELERAVRSWCSAICSRPCP